MKSIKPGRGPSIMGAIGSILAAAFGIVWTILAASMGVFIFAIFGIIFVIAAIVQAIFNYKNATGKIDTLYMTLPMKRKKMIL